MRKVLINVNGTKDEVEVEEIDPKAVRQAAPQAEPAKAPVAAKPVGEGEKVTSPMPGNILSVSVKEGDTVKEGQQLMILEAMKMENEIVAPKNGTITSVTVTKGASVQTDQVIATIQ
jgi:biotin carboxyl carrier protein